MRTTWRESRKVLVIVGVAAVAAGLLALAMTFGYYGRGSHYDECDPNQPWWNSPLLLLVPLTGISTIFAGSLARPGGRRLALRALMIFGGIGLVIWSLWFFGKLWNLGWGCGFP